jgi:hypothetical protein
MKLSDAQRDLILDRIEALFEGTKARLLGKLFRGPSLQFEVVRRTDPLHTIEGIYEYTLNMLYGAGAKPDKKILENLAEVTGNYIDAQQLKVKNHVLADVAKAKSPSEAIRTIRESFNKAGDYVDMLVANETRIVQAYASREGISQVAADLGVEDPTVVFLGITDTRICKYCKAMYHDSANLQKPKPYKLSQLQEGYFKPKDWDWKTPHQAPLHPRCRHLMVFVSPNFGYDESGMSHFVDFGYDYYKDYWKLKKSEELPPDKTPMADFLSYDEYLAFNIEHEKEHVHGPDCNHGEA